MEIDILEESKTRLKFKIKGEGHTLCNILREKLWEDEHVKIAAYRIEHQLVSDPTFLIETDGKETPEKALQKAVDSLKKDIKEMSSLISKVK